MKIQDIFEKPIGRPINGVIKADQSDAASVWQELDEYVVTRELDRHFRSFIDVYLGGGRDRDEAASASRNGVWVSGFFGSGKSHFIKILSYLIENRTATKDGVSRTAIDFFDDKIEDRMLAADMKRAVQGTASVVLFNVDSKADGQDEQAILRVFLRVFNEKLGFSADHPHIAHLERYLASNGKLEAFKAAFQKHSGGEWVEERDAYQFYTDAMMAALGEAMGVAGKDADAWFSRFEADFKPTIENFARWVAEYLDSSKTDRIVFLADEIGAFIGRDGRMMTNLQTVVENLGTICKGRAWVVVTSQADMDAVLEDLRSERANDFSKIQGRFRTRLSLSGAHANEVIQRRILAKTEAAAAELETLYKSKADILRNQVSFRDTGMTFKSYTDELDFAAVYPFVPYQFQLVQKVFDASRRHGATGAHLAKGERSMLDAFQTAALAVANDSTGRLVAFHQFYPAIESFLEDIVRRAIKSVDDNTSLKPFDAEVLKTLFLIRYIEEIKGNIDNLVTLFVNEIDCDRLALKRQIEESLQRLEGQTLVNRNGENYNFLTNEERDISKEIQLVQNSSAEETKLLNEIIFDEVIRNIARGKFRHKATSNDFDISRITDGHPYTARVDGALVLHVVTPLGDDYGSYDDAAATLKSIENDGQVIIRLDNDRDLAREVRRFLQTDKLINRKSGTQGGSVDRILREQGHENIERRSRIKVILDRLLQSGRVYAAGQRLESRSASPQALVDEALEYLVDNTFSKLELLTTRHDDARKEIPAVLREDLDQGFDLQGGETNIGALKEVRDYVALMDAASKQVVLFELAAKFARRPYGWNEWETVLLIARLVAKGEVSLASDGNTLPRNKMWDAVEGPNKWRRVTVHLRKAVSKDTLQKVRELGRDMFGKIGPDSEDALTAHLRGKFLEWQAELKGWLQLAADETYPGKSEMSDCDGVIRTALGIEDAAAFIEHLYVHRKDLQDIADDYANVSGFYNNQRKAWDDMRSALSRFKPNEAELLKDQGASQAMDRLKAILAMPAPYGVISEGAGLITQVEQVNTKLVNARRDHALQKVDEHIAGIRNELDQAACSSDVQNRVLRPLQQVRQRIASETSVAHIFQLQDQAKDAYDDAFDMIEQDVASRIIRAPQNPAPSPEAGIEAGGRSGESRPVPAPRKRSIVRAADLVKAGQFIETEADARTFVAALEKRLLDAIAKNERVEIR